MALFLVAAVSLAANMGKSRKSDAEQQKQEAMEDDDDVKVEGLLIILKCHECRQANL